MNECLTRYGTAKNLMQTFNPGMQFRYCSNVQRCFLGTAPTLTTLRLAHGEHIATSWLEIQLRDLSEFAGCREKLSIEQLEQIAHTIMLEFHYLKLTELMYFFVLFKAGRFGKFYGAVDGLVITEALQEFKKIRAEQLDRYEQERKRKESEFERKENALNAITREEWEELKWLWNM